MFPSEPAVIHGQTLRVIDPTLPLTAAHALTLAWLGGRPALLAALLFAAALALLPELPRPWLRHVPNPSNELPDYEPSRIG